MTGPVTYEQLYQLLAIFAAAGGIVVAAVGWVWRLVALLKKAYDATRRQIDGRIDDTDSRVALALERAKLAEETLRRELTDYQVHAAEHFASKSGVTVQIERLEEAVNGIAEKVDRSSDRITARIDRLLESQNATPPARRRTAD